MYIGPNTDSSPFGFRIRRLNTQIEPLSQLLLLNGCPFLSRVSDGTTRSAKHRVLVNSLNHSPFVHPFTANGVKCQGGVITPDGLCVIGFRTERRFNSQLTATETGVKIRRNGTKISRTDSVEEAIPPPAFPMWKLLDRGYSWYQTSVPAKKCCGWQFWWWTGQRCAIASVHRP